MFWSSRKTADLSFRYENVYVHPTAEIGMDVEVGPFSYIGPHCRIGDGTRIHNNVSIMGYTHMREGNEVFPGAVIGGVPQDKKYRGEETWVDIGSNNVIRECVTIHCGTGLGGAVTKIGSRNLIMACCHIAHDCILEDDITMANNVLLGGHVKVESFVGFGGLAAVHHFVTIGAHGFVGGLARVTQDIPPYMLVEGNPVRIWSTNKVGLRRHGVSAEAMAALKEAHRLLFRSKRSRKEAVEAILADSGHLPEVRKLLEFLENTQKGNQGRARQPAHGLGGEG